MAPLRSRAPATVERDGSLDDDVQVEYSSSIPQAIQNIENLKRARAQNHAGIIEDYEAAVGMWKEELTAHFTQQAKYMETQHSTLLHRLLDAIDKKLAIEEAIAAKIKALDDDRDHLAMLIQAVYTGRQQLAKEMTTLQSSVSVEGGKAKKSGK